MRDYSFGNFLRALRERRGLSQFQLGMLVGVSDKAVSKWENGASKPQSRLLFKLSDILGVTVDELLACRYRTEKDDRKGVFAMKNELWKKAAATLKTRCGDAPPVEVLNRYLSEFEELKATDMVIWFDLIGRISEAAKSAGGHILADGALGSSFTAHLMGATDVDPLRPHYYCPKCRTVEFSDAARCGCDLPEKHCSCGEKLIRGGFGLPFESLRPLVRKNVHFNIGIPDAFSQTAENVILKYFEGNSVLLLPRNEHAALKTVVIIDDVTDRPGVQELPFDENVDKMRKYPSITFVRNNDLAVISALERETGVPLDEADIASEDVIEAVRRGDTDGIPDFRSEFFRSMVKEARPKSFNDLVQLAGLSHGTGVWKDNAQKLIGQGTPVSDVIAYSDDVFDRVFERTSALGTAGSGYACMIAERARKGAFADGIPDSTRRELRELGFDDGFTETLSKIRYMFPKAHGAAYVRLVAAMVWYKVMFPETFARVIDM